MPIIDVEMDQAMSSSSNATGRVSSINNSQNTNHTFANTRKTSSGGKTDDPDDEIEEYNDSDDFDEPPEIMDEESDIFLSGGGGPSTDITTSRRPHPLLPDDYGDEAMAAIKFSEEFESRYGRPHPAFFPATLDDAIKESCMQPAKDVSICIVLQNHLVMVETLALR